ncbi:hypothetical protein [Hymenobacter sp. UYP22]|uniref:hypothetical protein n=1 Tax=Hymenobacter sp. UYP22 TaxID=3156348 RepID=UPI003394FB4B
MNQEQANQMIADGKIQPRKSYTYADLLAQLQALSPEQLQQQVWGWDENGMYDQLKLDVLEEDYVRDDYHYGPESDYTVDATPEELEDIATWDRLPKGTVVFQVSE